jgi:GT2 family glycosyltransferase
MLNTSIIIVNFNGKKHLKICLESIKKSEASEEEIIVVDNGSTDGSRAFLDKEYPLVKTVYLEKNYGFARANNIGAQNAAGDYLIFLNNDTCVSAGWCNSLINELLQNSEYGIAGSKLVLMDSPDTINSAGGGIVFNGGGYDIGFLDQDSKKYNKREEKGVVCGASLMVRRKEFIQLKGFDEMYFMYFEDVDLCWRYWLAGYKVIYVPE